MQPGHLQELMLHETAVSWLRARLEQSLPGACWKESSEEFGSRLRTCCAEVNATLQVEKLCRAFPKRVQQLLETEGERLRQ